MKPRTIIITVILAVVLLAGAFSGGFISGRLFTSREAITADAGRGSTPTDLQTLFKPFWQAWDLVHKQYVDQPVNDDELMRGAIRGMLNSLGDPHTGYLDPKEYQSLSASLQGEEKYEGIGAWVDTTTEYLTIIAPIPGSPAEKAGLRNGDKIIAVDGVDMTGVDGEVVRQKVLGPAGTTVRLTILRSGQDPFDVEIVRASITVPSVEGRMLEGNIAYVRLYIFSDNIGEELKKELETLLAQKPKGLILDLRDNGGGYLDSAVEVASEFIGEGVVVYEQYGDGTRRALNAKPGGLATDIPMVVLVNHGSASASEIVAGAIQDTKRGPLVGEQTFGKGSVQMPTTLVNGEGAVRITIARWLTPNGRTIHGVGLIPDYEVKLTSADTQANKDPQLDKAVEILTH